MKLKITGRNNVTFKENLECVLNIATIICKGGHLPTLRDIGNAETHGNWWVRSGNRFDLLASSNNHWTNISSVGDDFIIIEFNIRYDNGTKKKALENMLLAFFPEFVLSDF